MKIGIVVDSGAYLNPEKADKYDIHIAPLNVIVDGVNYKDEIDIHNSEVFEMIDAGKKVTTSQPSPKEFFELYEKMREEGYTDVISIHLSSGVSGTFQSAKLAADMVEGINVHPFDSETAACGIELHVDEALELIAQGKTVEEIFTQLELLRKTHKVRVTLDDLNTLVRGGRLSKLQGIIGSLLKVKPIIQVKETKLDVFGKARTMKKVVEKIVEELAEDVQNAKRVIVGISHINSDDVATTVKNSLEKISDKFIINMARQIGPAFAVHFGKGAIAVVWSVEY